jgi:uncharacterized membrane protein
MIAIRLRRAATELRASLWLVPVLCLLAGVGLSLVTVAIDRAADGELVARTLTGSPAAAQTALSTIATATASLASIVLTVTLVAVQLAMGQFSPRIVRALLNDRGAQLTIGVFVATFAFALLGLRAIEDQPAPGFVPGVTMLTAYALALGAVTGLLVFVHRAGQSLRVAGMVDLVGDETRRQLDRLYPERAPVREDHADPRLIPTDDAGVVVRVDRERLVAAAAEAGCRLELVPAAGDFVPTGGALLRVHGDLPRRDRRRVAALVTLGSERTHTQEPAYGIRKLVDMAERAVSDPFDDPSTTVQVIHRLHDCLRLLAGRDLPEGVHRDEGGTVRLTERVLSWEGYVRLAFDEVRLAGAASPQVARALRATLEGLVAAAPPERRAPLERQLELLRVGVHRRYEDAPDAAAAQVADVQGIGSGPDVTVAPDGASVARDGRAPTRSRS